MQSGSIANAFTNFRGREFLLQIFHQRPNERREEPQDPVLGRQIGDGIGGVDHHLAGDVGRTRLPKRVGRDANLEAVLLEGLGERPAHLSRSDHADASHNQPPIRQLGRQTRRLRPAVRPGEVRGRP